MSYVVEDQVGRWKCLPSYPTTRVFRRRGVEFIATAAWRSNILHNKSNC